MTTMPDYSLAVTFEGLLSPETEGLILDRIVSGTVIRHTDDGNTVVAVPFTAGDLLTATEYVVYPTARDLAGYVGHDPLSLELTPLTD